MENLITEVSKYVMIFSLAFYTLLGFRLVGKSNKKTALWQQNLLFFSMHLLGNSILYLNTDNEQIIYFYLEQLVVFLIYLILQRLCYPKCDKLLNHNLLLLLFIGLLILARLSFDKAQRQFQIAVFSMIFSFLVPWLIQKAGNLRNLYWFYGGAGLFALMYVLLFAQTSYGAKLSITVYGIALQPSEFVKILFVFFIAGMLYKKNDFRQVALTSSIAAVYVLILVGSKDLGGALIFFVTYLIMLYVASRKAIYLFAGMAAGSVAACIAWKLFSHVQIRVLAWSDPFSVIDNEGYQITQSLFAIGTGGWFGLGIGQGMPYKIPVVEQDFIFSAIAEELGILFAILLILVYLSCFYMILNIAMCLKDAYYKLVAVGLGTLLIFQVFLCVGGVIKFIPSTGVTLPFVSYGGSSLVSSFFIWAIIQGMYLKRNDEVSHNEKKKEK